ncbi:phosphoglucosamine mutase [Acidomonas methanolica]|uniref:phosphoglucosamine mutase n=1 Tax=Acidomonas methanolica TaxID=437 RepID=UPI00211A9486|nr:phosphoglucosamine mutase [Acidomonas methanolica]MCQ9154342.1 phosphoglucosamine mutase [Acidomonas methanolica]
MNGSKPRKLFGTDGIRGTSNQAPMTVDVAQRLGQAVGVRFRKEGHRQRVILGKDTRLSGYMIESALISGFLSAGMDVTQVGPLPTPAIAMLTRSLRADLGVVISASHNPFEDNGIKIFGPTGFKLSDTMESEIEAYMREDLSDRLAAPSEVGRASRLNDAAGRYVENAKASFPRGLRLDGMKIVIDCANGSAYRVAPTALWELGADVVKIGCEPNGININLDCGSTAPERLCAAVVQHGAQLGIALDGDADRVIISDEHGRIIDGDQILALIGKSWIARGQLRTNAVVATVMSNLGLEHFLAEHGVTLLRTAVGDRYVVEKMREVGANLGGEQSGHVVLSDYATTGDGLVAALQVLAVLVESDRPASEICRVFNPYPQMLRNIRYSGASPLGTSMLEAARREIEARLDGHGRLVLRASGTEPLIRVMVEADDPLLVEQSVSYMCDAIRALTPA